MHKLRAKSERLVRPGLPDPPPPMPSMLIVLKGFLIDFICSKQVMSALRERDPFKEGEGWVLFFEREEEGRMPGRTIQARRAGRQSRAKYRAGLKLHSEEG